MAGRLEHEVARSSSSTQDSLRIHEHLTFCCHWQTSIIDDWQIAPLNNIGLFCVVVDHEACLWRC